VKHLLPPEPVKQDLIDNEILESVPKTMKAKVQLLLKKMKSSPDISWNEKGLLLVRLLQMVPILVG
jgi:hypothetical protein